MHLHFVSDRYISLLGLNVLSVLGQGFVCFQRLYLSKYGIEPFFKIKMRPGSQHIVSTLILYLQNVIALILEILLYVGWKFLLGLVWQLTRVHPNVGRAQYDASK